MVQIAPRMLADRKISSCRQRKLCNPSLSICLAFSDGCKKKLERRIFVPVGCLQGYNCCILAEAHVRQPQHLLILRHGLRAVRKVLCSAAENEFGFHAPLFFSKGISKGVLHSGQCGAHEPWKLVRQVLITSRLSACTVGVAANTRQHSRLVWSSPKQALPDAIFAPVQSRACRWKLALSLRYCLATTASCTTHPNRCAVSICPAVCMDIPMLPEPRMGCIPLCPYRSLSQISSCHVRVCSVTATSGELQHWAISTATRQSASSLVPGHHLAEVRRAGPSG